MDRTQSWYLGANTHGRSTIYPAEETVHPVDVSFTAALKVFSKWGTGAGEFVRAMQPVSDAPQSRTPIQRAPDHQVSAQP